MSLLEQIEAIPIVNDHTHIFGCDVLNYEQGGRTSASFASPQAFVANLSGMNMQETVTANEPDPAKARAHYLRLYGGRKTTFGVRLMTRTYNRLFGFDYDEITVENVGPLLDRMREQVPEGDPQDVYAYFGRLSNCELYFSNSGAPDTDEPRATRGRFRWVPYVFDYEGRGIETFCEKQGMPKPQTPDDYEAAYTAQLRDVKARGGVAVKGGAFAYDLSRPFAPSMDSLAAFEPAKRRLEKGNASRADEIIVQDSLMILMCRAAGEAGLPVQIHVGLIWTAAGNRPTRIPELMDLVPVLHNCPKTTFVIFHGAYPRTDDLAHVAAVTTNVRAEMNWVPVWAGLDFPRVLGSWLDMIPADRILYGTDGGSFGCVAHDLYTRECLAQVLEQRVHSGWLSPRLAIELAARILRNNSIEVYGLDLPAYSV